jgi:hypothetical protein
MARRRPRPPRPPRPRPQTSSPNIVYEGEAIDDSATTQENTSVSINVLENDVIPEEARAFAIGSFDATTASGGTVEQDGEVLKYTPATDFTGKDTFEYTLTLKGEDTTGLVTVEVLDGGDVVIGEPVFAPSLGGGNAGDNISGIDDNDVIVGSVDSDTFAAETPANDNSVGDFSFNQDAVELQDDDTSDQFNYSQGSDIDLVEDQNQEISATSEIFPDQSGENF